MTIAKLRRTAKTAWTYNQITKTTEHRIKVCMESAREHADDRFVEGLHRHWAYGAYLVWNDLTTGWQNDGDSERMKALTDLKLPE